MLWAIQAVVGASDVVPCQELDVMESIHAISYYGWKDLPNQGLHSDALNSSTLFFVCTFTNIQWHDLRGSRSLGEYSDYLENTRSYFLCVFVVIPNLKDTVFGGVYGMDETSDFGVCNYCAIERYHRVRSLGESNKQIAWQKPSWLPVDSRSDGN